MGQTEVWNFGNKSRHCVNPAHSASHDSTYTSGTFQVCPPARPRIQYLIGGRAYTPRRAGGVAGGGYYYQNLASNCPGRSFQIGTTTSNLS